MRKDDVENLQNSKYSIERVVHAELFPEIKKELSRARALSILTAAIECYRHFGIENTTYERIAKAAKITRPLIFKYFTDYDDIFYKSVKLIRGHFQIYAVTAIQKQSTVRGKFEAYVDSTFDWVDRFPAYSSGLLLYLQRCSWEERSRDLNTEFAQVGQARIAAMIRFGVASNEFAVSNTLAAPEKIAKQLQTIIAGALVTYACENHSAKAQYRAETMELCLSLVGVRSSVA